MSRARVNADGDLVFEDPVRRIEVMVYDHEGDACISPPAGAGIGIWIRASDAASVGDWLRRTFAEADWRIGVDPANTSIPLCDALEHELAKADRRTAEQERIIAAQREKLEKLRECLVEALDIAAVYAGDGADADAMDLCRAHAVRIAELRKLTEAP